MRGWPSCALGIAPVAGFLHHRLGPEDLSPLDEGFDAAFGDYAEAVAMARIRRVTPRAMLVQTEDVGRVFAGAGLGYQAEYENLRRFLFFDLICGRVGPEHGFWRRLVAAGVTVADLQALRDAPCAPDIIGIDHYLTSDRYLDPDLGAHPHTRSGGNGRDRYVDVAAVHVPALEGRCGVMHRIREVHRRYRLPIVLTEVHNRSSREEQLRWLDEGWRAACQARDERIAVKAVTVWSMLGTVDWNSLLVTRAGHYECGAFDVRVVPPRLTALGQAVAELIETGRLSHPVLERPGWWRSETAPAGGALVSVRGDELLAMALREACELRRLTPGPAPALGTIRAERMSDGAGLRFHCAGLAGRLVVGTSATAWTDGVAPAVLDLLIDGETGLVRLARVGPYGQYRAEWRVRAERGAVTLPNGGGREIMRDRIMRSN